MNDTQAAETTASARQVRHLWWQRPSVRLGRREVGRGDMHGLRRQRSALTCRQTGSPRGSGACLAGPRGCAYCGLPAPTLDARLRLDALLDERAQYAAEDFR